MSLQQKIDEDLKKAMIAKDTAKVSTLRFLKSALKYSAIEKKTDLLNDSDIQQLIQKQIKQHRESIDQFMKAGRKELVEKEAEELDILESYLPKQISEAELETLVRKELKETGASSKKDFGKMMKILNEKCAGQADAKRISELLGRFLT